MLYQSYIIHFFLWLNFLGLNINFNLQLENSKNVLDVSGGKSTFFGKDSDVLKNKGIPADHIEVQRREKVKGAMLHAWTSYEKYAWGQDELQVHVQ